MKTPFQNCLVDQMGVSDHHPLDSYPYLKAPRSSGVKAGPWSDDDDESDGDLHQESRLR